jgi:hypothetical protein
VAEYLDSPISWLFRAALLLAFVDFGVGVFASVKDDTFALDAIGAFLRKHLAGRVLPISLLALAAYIGMDTFLLVAAGLALIAYGIETIGSVMSSYEHIERPDETKRIPED